MIQGIAEERTNSRVVTTSCLAFQYTTTFHWKDFLMNTMLVTHNLEPYMLSGTALSDNIIAGVKPAPSVVPEDFLEDCIFHAPEPLTSPAQAALLQGAVKLYQPDKKYGFLHYVDRQGKTQETFFHLTGCIVPTLVVYHYPDHQLMQVEERPLRQNAAGYLEEECPYVLSKGMRLTFLLYENLEAERMGGRGPQNKNKGNGLYAGRWYASSVYEQTIAKATQIAVARRQQIVELPHYELVREEWTGSESLTSFAWNTVGCQDIQRDVLLRTNKLSALKNRWFHYHDRLSRKQRLVVIQHNYDAHDPNGARIPVVMESWQEIKNLQDTFPVESPNAQGREEIQ